LTKKESVIARLKSKLVVSCQAYEDSPLYGGDYMLKMAECAILGGAGGLRLCWAENVEMVRKITDLPIIGINKVIPDEIDLLNSVFITPTFESAVGIIEAGADVIALDCTPRGRTYQDVGQLIRAIQKAYPDTAIMADISTAEEGIMAAEMGVDIVSTTLSGYTPASGANKSDKPDLEIIRALKKSISAPVNAEGRIWDLTDLENVIACGPDMVTVGTAITRPNLISKRFADASIAYFGGK